MTILTRQFTKLISRERDLAMDFIAASLAITWSAAVLSSDGVGPRSIGVLVGGLERTQGIDVLVTAGTISPAHIPSEVGE